MNTVQATAYGAKSLISMLLGHSPQADAKATVNERLDILGTARPTSTEKVYLGVLIAGNKGHVSTIGEDGIALTSIQDHFATNASLYGPMPFCMRAIDDDIPQELRAKYALRTIELIGTQQYYVYYGLRMNISPEDVVVRMQKVTTENGIERFEDFVPDTSDLFPTPITLPSTGAVTTTDVKIKISCMIEVVLNEEDITEYVNCAKIKFGGDERYAIMSEFALCIGADRAIDVTTTAGTVKFLESIGTQIYNFAADFKAVYYNTQELTIDFDIGNQIPMLGVQSIPTLETIGVTT